MLAAKLSGDALPRPQMQVKLAGFARAELGKQAVTLSNLVMGVDDALLSGNGSVQLGAVPKVEFDLKGRSWISTVGSVSRPRRRLRPPPRRRRAAEHRRRPPRPPPRRSPLPNRILPPSRRWTWLADCNWAACASRGWI